MPDHRERGRKAWDWDGQSTSWNRRCCMKLIRAEYVAAVFVFLRRWKGLLGLKELRERGVDTLLA